MGNMVLFLTVSGTDNAAHLSITKGGYVMTEKKPADELSEKDRLLTRPENGPLPTAEDPSAPHARGYPVDPKPKPKDGQGTDPRANDLEHSA